jgi:hypothetical protein
MLECWTENTRVMYLQRRKAIFQPANPEKSISSIPTKSCIFSTLSSISSKKPLMPKPLALPRASIDHRSLKAMSDLGSNNSPSTLRTGRNDVVNSSTCSVTFLCGANCSWNLFQPGPNSWEGQFVTLCPKFLHEPHLLVKQNTFLTLSAFVNMLTTQAQRHST